MLRAMREAGHLVCEAKTVGGKRRKNYRATADGRRLLAAAREKLTELVEEIVHDHDAMKARRARAATARRPANRETKPSRGR